MIQMMAPVASPDMELHMAMDLGMEKQLHMAMDPGMGTKLDMGAGATLGTAMSVYQKVDNNKWWI